jgi:hypothetical protein
MTNLFPITTETSQIPALDTAVGEIIPITQEQSMKQLKSTLQEDALVEFQTNGQYEDTQASKQVKRMEVSLEKLFVSLDDVASALESTGTGQRVHMKLTNNQDADISICTQDNYPQKSCTLYLVSKSGQSIPVTVVMSSTGQNGESIITLKQSAGAGEDSNIYTAKPIALDIRAI